MFQKPVVIKKAVLHGAGDLRIEDELCSLDDLKSDELFVRTEVTGFSTGTDLGNYEGRSAEVPNAPDYPRSVGYSNVGTVEAVGAEVRLFASGDRVFSTRPHRSGYRASEKDLLVRIPPGVEPEQASLSYLIQLGVAALRKVHYEPGERVAVVGLGVIGLCTVAVCRAMGARVVAIANDSRRAQLALRVGASEAFIGTEIEAGSIFGGRGADVVILTANTWAAYQTAVEAATFCGRVSVLGFPGRAQPRCDFNPVDMQWLYGKQLTIAGAGYTPAADSPSADVRFNLRRNLEFILESMESGLLNVGPIISHRFRYTEMTKAYDIARDHGKEMSAAVFLWT